MLLRITVLQYKGAPPGALQAYMFDERGGSIGREADCNQLVLPDPTRVVSRVQSQIVFSDGAFRIIDQGGNPSHVNGLRVGKGNSRVIYDGDVIEMGDYKLHVRAIGNSAAVDTPDPAATNITGTIDTSIDMSFDMDIDYDEPVTTVPLRQPPIVMPTAPAIQAVPPMPAEHAELMRALCRGLGINPLDLPAGLTTHFMEHLGSLLRAAMVGAVTSGGIEEGNTLSPAAEAAIRQMLVPWAPNVSTQSGNTASADRLAADADDPRTAFGREFLKAFEAQMARLQTRR